jgi:CheY-like chemotaxis protein
LLLLDLDMPRKSGLQVLAWIRQQPEFQELPVIVLTTSVFSSDVRAAYALGANSFLVKPVDFTDLVSMVRHACDFWLAPARQNARPVVSPADTPPPAPLASSSNVLDQPPAQPGKRGI